MGVKRIKIKDEVNYRRGQAAKKCEFCQHFVDRFPVRDKTEPRCKVIGLKEGRGYKVSRNNLCDCYKEFESSVKTPSIR